MRTSPSIVPHGADRDTDLVLDDFGRIGCSLRETDVESADRETLIRDLVDGQYSKPVLARFNTSEGWSRDATLDIADATLKTKRCRSRSSTSWMRTGAERGMAPAGAWD